MQLRLTAEKYAKSLDVSDVVQSWKFGQVGNLEPMALRLTVAGPSPRSKDHPIIPPTRPLGEPLD
jgi:hypothetical protein